jgi:pilus assembly protein CpaC
MASILLVCSGMILLFWITLFSHARSLNLYPGMESEIKSPPGAKILVEKKGYVTIKDLGRRLKIVGKKAGSTRLTIGKENYEINVIKESAFKTYKKLLLWQEGKLGPLILVENGRVSVGGDIYSFLDWKTLSDLMNGDDEFSLKAKVDGDTREQIKKHLVDLSNSNNIPFGVFNQHPEWEISFNASEKSNTASYRKIFSPLGIKISQSNNALSAVPMIEVNIIAAEVKRGEISKFGVNWPETAQVQVVPKLGLNPENIFANVDLFEQQGWGKVLASPTLLAQSGEEATFHSGGEIPIKSSNQYNSNVSWKKYGIILKIKPKADFTGKMSIDIECEISMIDTSSMVDGVPGLLMNRLSSHFNLSESKTIALSGLIKQEWGESQQGLPGFKNIPIFSQLFSSKHYRNNQSELMFFVTPKIIK